MVLTLLMVTLCSTVMLAPRLIPQHFQQMRWINRSHTLQGGSNSSYQQLHQVGKGMG